MSGVFIVLILLAVFGGAALFYAVAYAVVTRWLGF